MPPTLGESQTPSWICFSYVPSPTDPYLCSLHTGWDGVRDHISPWVSVCVGGVCLSASYQFPLFSSLHTGQLFVLYSDSSLSWEWVSSPHIPLVPSLQPPPHLPAETHLVCLAREGVSHEGWIPVDQRFPFEAFFFFFLLPELNAELCMFERVSMS